MSNHTPTPYFPDNLENYAPWVAKYGLLHPYGECQCGCEREVAIATQTDRRRGRVMGMPNRFLDGHSLRKKVISTKGVAPWVEKHGLRYPYGECQCGCGKATWVATFTSHKYGWTKGYHLPFYRNHGSRLLIDKSFWSKVEKRGLDDCWEWTGYRDKAGYGKLRHNGRNARAPRVSWEIHNGHIPDGLIICHRCDNPSCVNPNHLFLGTDADNVADKLQKGRQPRGSEHGQAKLTEDQVVAIREKYVLGNVTYRELAIKYGVTRRAIRNAVARKTWKHVL